MFVLPSYSASDAGAEVIDTQIFGMGPIFLQNLECMEGETAILDCFRRSPLGQHDCDHSQDVSVSCKGIHSIIAYIRQ